MGAYTTSSIRDSTRGRPRRRSRWRLRSTRSKFPESCCPLPFSTTAAPLQHPCSCQSRLGVPKTKISCFVSTSPSSNPSSNCSSSSAQLHRAKTAASPSRPLLYHRCYHYHHYYYCHHRHLPPLALLLQIKTPTRASHYLRSGVRLPATERFQKTRRDRSLHSLLPAGGEKKSTKEAQQASSSSRPSFFFSLYLSLSSWSKYVRCSKDQQASERRLQCRRRRSPRNAETE